MSFFHSDDSISTLHLKEVSEDGLFAFGIEGSLPVLTDFEYGKGDGIWYGVGSADFGQEEVANGELPNDGNQVYSSIEELNDGLANGVKDLKDADLGVDFVSGEGVQIRVSTDHRTSWKYSNPVRAGF